MPQALWRQALSRTLTIPRQYLDLCEPHRSHLPTTDVAAAER